jgi:uncharacterized protein
MVRCVAAFAAGLLFGAGLSLSRMINPAVVLSFLDFASVSTGGWNPALALVMAGALAVTAIGYRLAFRRGSPLFAPAFDTPRTRAIDARLIGGALVFGVGWGLAGYCPGPAIAGLGLGAVKTWVFVGAMLAGVGIHRILFARPGLVAPLGPSTS